MKNKKFLGLLMFLSFKSFSSFEGCGDYLFKGELVKSESESDQKKWGSVYYKVNKKTQSELNFKITNSDDLSKVASYLNVPSELNVSVVKKMDGTEGEIENINSVKLRTVHDLNSSLSNGVFLVKLNGCEK